MSPIDTDRLKRQCTRCFYDLRGLPDPCDCPECGHPSPKGAYIWRPPWPWRWVILPAVLLPMLEINVAMSIFPRAMNSWRWGFLTMLVVSAFTALVVIAVGRFLIRRGQFVQVEEGGIRYRLYGLQVRFLPWRQIEKVIPARYDRQCMIVVTPDAEGIHQRYWLGEGRGLNFQVFRSTEDAAMFIELVQSRRSGVA